ncbi:MAG: hypothetical protein K2Y16_13800 [Burkholderiales bacterium]|nr:hypothetical protein [Burkholderiales bacterium]
MAAEANTVEMSIYLRNRIPDLLGATPEDAQRIADAIVQHVGQAQLGGPGVVICRDMYETFVTVPLPSGSKASCVVYFEITPEGRRVVKRLTRSKR